MNTKGGSVHLPTNPLNRLGYDLEFDKSSKFEGFRIDGEAPRLEVGIRVVTLTEVPAKQDELYQ